MEKWISKTAWPMTAPAPYSSFHLLFASAKILSAFWLAWLLRKSRLQLRLILLFVLGIFLAFSEGYKQFFLYYIVNHNALFPQHSDCLLPNCRYTWNHSR